MAPIDGVLEALLEPGHLRYGYVWSAGGGGAWSNSIISLLSTVGCIG